MAYNKRTVDAILLNQADEGYTTTENHSASGLAEAKAQAQRDGRPIFIVDGCAACVRELAELLSPYGYVVQQVSHNHLS